MSELPEDDLILARMAADAERLCASADELMVGQYRHLLDRIRALIEIRSCFTLPREDEA